MAIEFLCPNGHKLSCGEERAGRTAKCPKCGVAVQIPSSSTSVGGTTAGGTTTGGTTATGSGIFNPASGSDTRPRDSGELQVGSGIGTNTITFYCPNGHKLSGSIKLQGRTGQCPHCSEKFRIPSLEELEAAQAPAAEPESGGGLTGLWDTASAAAPAADEPHEPEPTEAQLDVEFGVPANETIATADPDFNYFEMPEEAHPLCRLFDKLWEEKTHGGIVELHIRDAGTLVPDWFERRLSLESHGLFAVQAADGTLTLTAVAWESVIRVVVRNVVALPEGMFE